MKTLIASATVAGLLSIAVRMAPAQLPSSGPRARDLGVAPGIFRPGPFNAITDVAGVRVGHATVIDGDSVRTGVTAILPPSPNPFLERVPAVIVVGNGHGKLVGQSQVDELGELETPILLTCTLCVWRAADALVDWMLAQPGMEQVRSINPVVGETNDGGLSAIRSRPIAPAHVRAALDAASGGPVEEGSVGAGTGTVAFGWKGGIGTSSRRLPVPLGGWTVGVLVQSNYGGVLQVLGVPVGKELGQYSFRQQVERGAGAGGAGGAGGRGGRSEGDAGTGSIMIVLATDAPILERNLRRLATRALLGLGRTGSSMGNTSGDYVIGFATHPSIRRPAPQLAPRADSLKLTRPELANSEMSALFEAAVEATEEAIYNSLFRAMTVSSRFGTVDALPLDRVRELLQRYGASRR